MTFCQHHRTHLGMTHLENSSIFRLLTILLPQISLQVRLRIPAHMSRLAVFHNCPVDTIIQVAFAYTPKACFCGTLSGNHVRFL